MPARMYPKQSADIDFARPAAMRKVDRPFLFVVYDKPAKTVLFAAKVESV